MKKDNKILWIIGIIVAILIFSGKIDLQAIFPVEPSTCDAWSQSTIQSFAEEECVNYIAQGYECTVYKATDVDTWMACATLTTADTSGSYSCSETDGYDISVKGSCTSSYPDGTSDTMTEECWDNELLEYFCHPDPYLEGEACSLEFYVCPNGCSNGACIKTTTPTYFCTDIDGGKDYSTKGTVSEYVGDFTDVCGEALGWDSGTLIEYYCDGDFVASELYNCPSGSCSNGVCVEAQPTEGVCCKQFAQNPYWTTEEECKSHTGYQILTHYPTKPTCEAQLKVGFNPKLGSYEPFQANIYTDDFVDAQFQIWNEGTEGGKIKAEAVILSEKNAIDLGYIYPGNFQAVFPTEKVTEIDPCSVGEEFKEAVEVELGPAGSTSKPYGDVLVTVRVDTPSKTSKLGDGRSNYADNGKYVILFGIYDKCYDSGTGTGGYLEGMEGVKGWILWEQSPEDPLTFYGYNILNVGCVRTTDSALASVPSCDWTNPPDPDPQPTKKKLGEKCESNTDCDSSCCQEVGWLFKSYECVTSDKCEVVPGCDPGEKYCTKEKQCIPEGDWTENRCTAVTPPGPECSTPLEGGTDWGCIVKKGATYAISGVLPIPLSIGSLASTQDCISESGTHCAISMTKKEFSEATDAAIAFAACDISGNCAPYHKEGYTVSCVNQDTAGVRIGGAIESGFSWIAGTKEKGVCLARSSFDLMGWIEENLGLTGAVAVAVLFGAGILIIFLLNMLLSPKPR